MNVLAKILIFYESHNKKQRNLFGNGCGKWERLRERLRKKSRFFSCFFCKNDLSLQREKEKTTLYTRNIIVETLQTVLPQVVSMCINAYHLMKNEAVESVEVNLPFGEYANPSFESQVETVGKAKQSGIMSIERCVEELYGDSLDDDCKQEEIARLKAEQGIQSIPEPEIRTDAGEFRINGFTGGSDGSKSSEKNIPDEPGGIPGAPEGGQ